jgi:ABC-2 type transport system ATP-binding protein
MIHFQNVSKTFKRNRVLDGIGLDIGLGERVALIGSNGAGKTTLIRCLLGEYTHEGEVAIDGLAPRTHRTEVLAKVGFVPQLPPPLKMPVGQLIGFAAALCGSDPQRIADWRCASASTSRIVRSQPFVKLSGGQKQKILIAIALGRDAKVLVMDEPAANLDPEARKIFFELLAERQHDTTMLISSHRLNEVAALVNRVVELDMGRWCSTTASPTTSRSPACSTAASASSARAGLRQGARRLGFPRLRRRPRVDRRSGRPRPPALPRHDQPLRRADRRPVAGRGGKSQSARGGDMSAFDAAANGAGDLRGRRVATRSAEGA